MVKSAKKAFTLVELIVVITILAILGTIAFISLQGYSAEARDARRLSNVNDLTRKINIELVKGATPATLLSGTTETASGRLATTFKIDGVTGGTGIEGGQGFTNFNTIMENRNNFLDPIANVDYPLAIAKGGSGSGAYLFTQMATVQEAKGTARVVGNYYPIEDITKSDPSLIKASDFVVDGGTVLPY